MAEACDAYQDFVKVTLDEGVEEKVIENLRFLIQHGDITTYEWKYGEKPISVEQAELAFVDGDEDTAADQIDFDDNIDFGDSTVDSGAVDFGEGEEIDFGDSGNEEVIDFGGDDGDAVIDFDIDSVDTSAIVVEAGGLAGGVAREEEALSLLDNRRTRALLLDELEELAGFLGQRLVEMESTSNKFSLSGSAGQQQHLHDPDMLRKMIHNVEKIR